MSKAGNLSSDTDPNTVVVLQKRGPAQKTLKTDAALNQAIRSGATIETSRKLMGGTNKQHQAVKSAAKLDEDPEDFHHDHVSLSVGRAIQQGRQAKEWTQKDLAVKINEKHTVINEYESGKAVPNQQVLAKLERTLGIKLRGKDIGQPLESKPKKK